MYGKKGELSPSFGLKRSDEHRTNMSLVRKGKSRTEESKQKQSVTNTGRTFTSEHRSKIGRPGELNGMYGKKLFKESIEKGLETKKRNRLNKKIDKILTEGMVIYHTLPEKKNANILMLHKGVHPSQTLVSCLCCKKEVSIGMFGRWHKQCSLGKKE